MSAPPPYNPAVPPPQPEYAYQQPPPPQPQPAYQGYPPPSGGMQQQQNTNVVVVQAPAQQPTHTTVIRDNRPNHCLHCVITFFCPWYLLIWIIICCAYGC